MMRGRRRRRRRRRWVMWLDVWLMTGFPLAHQTRTLHTTTPHQAGGAVAAEAAEEARVTYGVCLVDPTTGAFHVGQFEDGPQRWRLRTLLSQFSPSEVGPSFRPSIRPVRQSTNGPDGWIGHINTHTRTLARLLLLLLFFPPQPHTNTPTPTPTGAPRARRGLGQAGADGALLCPRCLDRVLAPRGGVLGPAPYLPVRFS